MPTNPFVWFDNMGTKPAETSEFLSKNFGWDITQFGPLTVLVDGENAPFADTVDNFMGCLVGCRLLR